MKQNAVQRCHWQVDRRIFWSLSLWNLLYFFEIQKCHLECFFILFHSNFSFLRECSFTHLCNMVKMLRNYVYFFGFENKEHQRRQTNGSGYIKSLPMFVCQRVVFFSFELSIVPTWNSLSLYDLLYGFFSVRDICLPIWNAPSQFYVMLICTITTVSRRR